MKDGLASLAMDTGSGSSKEEEVPSKEDQWHGGSPPSPRDSSLQSLSQIRNILEQTSQTIGFTARSESQSMSKARGGPRSHGPGVSGSGATGTFKNGAVGDAVAAGNRIPYSNRVDTSDGDRTTMPLGGLNDGVNLVG
ncbi:unnamed protein product [Lota lota]